MDADMRAIPLLFSTLAVKTPSFLSREDTTQWVVLAVGALATLYLLMRPRLKAKKDPLEHRPALGVSQQRQIERDMSNLMVEMLETARQMTAQLDTRAARLEVLIEQADQRLSALRSGTSADTVSPPGEQSTPAQVETSEIPPDPRHADIWALADKGQSPSDIARQLNRPNGEIELILALRPH
jgi:hypothetical protein